jgi:hypothetical protein
MLIGDCGAGDLGKGERGSGDWGTGVCGRIGVGDLLILSVMLTLIILLSDICRRSQ